MHIIFFFMPSSPSLLLLHLLHAYPPCFPPHPISSLPPFSFFAPLPSSSSLLLIFEHGLGPPALACVSAAPALPYAVWQTVCAGCASAGVSAEQQCWCEPVWNASCKKKRGVIRPGRSYRYRPSILNLRLALLCRESEKMCSDYHGSLTSDFVPVFLQTLLQRFLHENLQDQHELDQKSMHVWYVQQKK